MDPMLRRNYVGVPIAIGTKEPSDMHADQVTRNKIDLSGLGLKPDSQELTRHHKHWMGQQDQE
eukprot:7623968-Ditylum_brightwellii.AAC.2